MRAARVLSSPDAKVTVLHVKEKIPSYAISYIPADYEANLKAAIRDRLEGLAAQFEDSAGVLIEGHSNQTILEWVEANQVDCIVHHVAPARIARLFSGRYGRQGRAPRAMFVHVIR